MGASWPSLSARAKLLYSKDLARVWLSGWRVWRWAKVKPHATPRFGAGYHGQIVLLRDEMCEQGNGDSRERGSRLRKADKGNDSSGPYGGCSSPCDYFQLRGGNFW